VSGFNACRAIFKYELLRWLYPHSARGFQINIGGWLLWGCSTTTHAKVRACGVYFVPFGPSGLGCVDYEREADPEKMPDELAKVFIDFEERIHQQEELGRLQDATGMMFISDWQPNLKKVILRIEWTDPKSGTDKEFEHEYYLHRDRRRGE